MGKHIAPEVFGKPMRREDESGDYVVRVGNLTAAIYENRGYRAWIDGMPLGPRRRSFADAARDIEQRLVSLRDAITALKNGKRRAK